MNRKRTIIYFNYGGYYLKNGDDIEWIAREDVVYSVMIKTSKKKISYSMLVDEVQKKIMINESTTELKFSYIPLPNSRTRKRSVYIKDDEDVYVCLMTEVDDKSFLYVELVEKEGGQNMSREQIWRMGRETEVTLVNEEAVHNMSFDHHNDIGLTNMDLVSSGGAYDTVLTESLEDVDVSLEEDTNVDHSGFYEDAEFTINEGVENVTHEWEDGIDMVVGKVFENKRAVQDIIEKASRENCFEFDIIKTDTKLYVVKCHSAKKGSKWSIRVARDKNSNCFSVRTYNKIHTCSRTSTSSSRSRRKGTSWMVVSVLNEDYPGQLNTPTPNSLRNVVQNRFGVLVSYTTAWRGKNEAV